MASPGIPSFELEAGDAESYLDHLCGLDVSSTSHVRLTGIVCSVGPTSHEPEMLEKMMESGMGIARLNFSYENQEYHAETIRNIRIAADNYSKKIGMIYPVAIALDTKGPEIRTGSLDAVGPPEVELKKGEIIKLTTDKVYADKGNSQVIYVDYDNIQKVVQMGNKIYIDEGLISLVCTNIQGSFLICIIENGGMLRSRKNVNLPGVPLDLPAVSERDKSDLLFGIEQGIDIIFASFIRNAQALTEIRNVLGDKGQKILVISKIENHQGMQNLNEIIRASDGIMIARGELSIEIPTEKLFLTQKLIIARCNKFGKPVICATHMLESMTGKPRPKRAESTDIANAVLDGADCFMLSGETAKGKYPLECVLAMHNACKEAESAIWQKQLFISIASKAIPPIDVTHAIAIAAVEASIKCIAAAIIVLTTSGKSAQFVSRYRPKCPIIAITRNHQTARQCRLFRGILSIIFEDERLEDWLKDVDARLQFGFKYGKAQGFVKTGDPVVVVTGWRQGSGCTNSLRIVHVESSTTHK